MRVAIITYYFYPIKGGIENHCFNLAKYLAKNEHEVIIYTANKTPSGKKFDKKSEIIEKFKVIRLDNFWKFIPNFKKFDIIHLHNFNIFPHFWILLKALFYKLLNKKRQRPKIVITLHGGFTPWWLEFPFLKRIFKRLYHKTIGKFLLNYAADVIIAVSEWEKEQLIKEGIKKYKIVVIPNGVEDLAFELPKQEDKELKKYKPYILFLGRIAKIKNLEFAISSMNRIYDNVKLIIAGPICDVTYYQYLKSLIKKLRIEERVIFIPKEIVGREKYALIDNALAIILVSHQLQENRVYEAIIVKEAVTRGKPVIIKGKEFKQFQSGFIVSTKEEFKKVVRELLYNKQLIENIEKVNKSISNMWKWENIGKQLEKIYLIG